MSIRQRTAPAGGGHPPAKQVDVYDFRRPTTLVREHSRVLEIAFETFARQWGTQLTAKVRVVSTVSLDSVVMKTYDDYVSALPPTTAMVLCEIDGMNPRAVIQFPNTAALTWVAHMLGGGTENAPDRKFTQIEQALIRNLMDDAIEDLHYSLGSLLTAPVQVQSIQHNSQFAQAAPTAELMVVATFDMRVGEFSAPGTVAIPADAILPQLGEANPTASTTDAAELMRGQVAAAPVDVAIQLAPAAVTPAQVLALAVGDLITLPHPATAPMAVTVEGTTIARAAVAEHRSRIACLIVNTEETSR